MVHGNWTHRTLLQLSLIGAADGNQIVNTFHFEATSTTEASLTSDSVANTLAAALAADWNTNLKTAFLAQLFSNYTLNEVRAQVLERPGNFEHRLASQSVFLTSGNTGTDGSAGIALPHSSCVDIKWRSAGGGRHARGRSFISPIQSGRATTNAQQVLNPNTSLYNTFAQAMLTRYIQSTGTNTLTVDFTIYNRPYSAPKGAYAKRVGGVLTVVNNTTDYDGDVNHILTAVVDPVIRQQRRREQGVGS